MQIAYPDCERSSERTVATSISTVSRRAKTVLGPARRSAGGTIQDDEAEGSGA
jgi:hypothetical protein